MELADMTIEHDEPGATLKKPIDPCASDKQHQPADDLTDY
jgi:hypothetical protein